MLLSYTASIVRLIFRCSHIFFCQCRFVNSLQLFGINLNIWSCFLAFLGPFVHRARKKSNLVNRSLLSKPWSATHSYETRRGSSSTCPSSRTAALTCMRTTWRPSNAWPGGSWAFLTSSAHSSWRVRYEDLECTNRLLGCCNVDSWHFIDFTNHIRSGVPRFAWTLFCFWYFQKMGRTSSSSCSCTRRCFEGVRKGREKLYLKHCQEKMNYCSLSTLETRLDF